ncbi:Septum formation initiator [Streptomyces venezuelae]|uniref:FtsB family cell division protein n=1 Tax=Streptomyces gardneri TaxID=66892 RepID=UPI0006BDF21C|nr:septum formation initiator family protein [Streptomyces gardneri]ALO08889.1 Septum formation initiator [Streptomyces venezuelae]QPK46057.1 septum formation initiator family protein [Streptomyces gardneri]WRK37416.1 septum formation initiator family protein [Streptomyces venezuelae]CUM40724.1 Cell division protein DivIC (FtsB), stabilizes FtsL against RasP cleavage [Streptomyces venezuelae]
MAAKDRDRFSTATRIRLLGEQTAARVYRSQTRRQARRSRLTGRAAFLALVVCSLVVALAYPMRSYVSQQGEIEDQERRAAETAQRVEELRDEKARLQDPAYVRRLAREHLHYLLPGETGFTVNDPDAEQRPRDDQGAAERPWYDNLWDGVDQADRP